MIYSPGSAPPPPLPHLNSGLSGINDVGVNETIWPLSKEPTNGQEVERRTWPTGQSTVEDRKTRSSQLTFHDWKVFGKVQVGFART